MNEKGQSSFGDAMFFLFIVTILSTSLFFFISGYGTTAKRDLTREYRAEFGTSAIQTILASNVPRAGCVETVMNAAEVDTLLAMMKEDFADNYQFSYDTKLIFKRLVEEIMLPINSSFDYFFFIYIPDVSSILSAEEGKPIVEMTSSPTVSGTGIHLESKITYPPGAITKPAAKEYSWQVSSGTSGITPSIDIDPLPPDDFDIVLIVTFDDYTTAEISVRCSHTSGNCGQGLKDNQKFPLALLKYTQPDAGFLQTFDEEDREPDYSKLPEKAGYFFCNPPGINKIEDSLILRASNITLPPASRVYFEILDKSKSQGRITAIANLYIWPSTSLEADTTKPGDLGITDMLGCKQYEEELTKLLREEAHNPSLAPFVEKDTCKQITGAPNPALTRYYNFKLYSQYSIVASATSIANPQWTIDRANPLEPAGINYKGIMATGDPDGRTAILEYVDSSGITQSLSRTITPVGFECEDTDSGKDFFMPGVAWGFNPNPAVNAFDIIPMPDGCNGNELVEQYCDGEMRLEMPLITGPPIDCKAECNAKDPSGIANSGTCEYYSYPLAIGLEKAGYCKCEFSDGTIRDGPVTPGDKIITLLQKME